MRHVRGGLAGLVAGKGQYCLFGTTKIHQIHLALAATIPTRLGYKYCAVSEVDLCIFLELL
jgi:hypothetical protein